MGLNVQVVSRSNCHYLFWTCPAVIQTYGMVLGNNGIVFGKQHQGSAFAKLAKRRASKRCLSNSDTCSMGRWMASSVPEPSVSLDEHTCSTLAITQKSFLWNPNK